MTVYRSELISQRASQVQAGDPLSTRKSRGRRRVLQGNIQVVASDLEADDIIVFAGIPSNASVMELGLQSDDLDSGVTLTFDLGLYRLTNGPAGQVFIQPFPGPQVAPIAQDVYASGSTIFQAAPAAPSLYTDLAFDNRPETATGRPVWEDAGLTEDPNEEFFIVATITGAGDTAGTIAFRFVYAVD